MRKENHLLGTPHSLVSFLLSDGLCFQHRQITLTNSLHTYPDPKHQVQEQYLSVPRHSASRTFGNPEQIAEFQVRARKGTIVHVHTGGVGLAARRRRRRQRFRLKSGIGGAGQLVLYVLLLVRTRYIHTSPRRRVTRVDVLVYTYSSRSDRSVLVFFPTTTYSTNTGSA
ncbi:hypothetical protein FN846DRAFT_962569 [Sphaerosporella brunnea]|uniref:Uncharacterized protein n=1 Tax=Sphaerosporella brunnea TaxID=1250544 RepID=A0A5J5EP74_9PEZI|nr:hypothetical protein FN846DRAFT_962569 [Sphaerosporella brunnea]